MHENIANFTKLSEDEVERATAMLRMLADSTRVRILWALAQGESSVACLADLAGTTPTAVSQHLSKLRLAGLVRARRQGTFQYYTVADDEVVAVLEAIIGRRVVIGARRPHLVSQPS